MIKLGIDAHAKWYYVALVDAVPGRMRVDDGADLKIRAHRAWPQTLPHRKFHIGLQRSSGPQGAPAFSHRACLAGKPKLARSVIEKP